MIQLVTLFVSGLTCVLPAQIKVRGTEIDVGAIAQIKGDDAELVARAGKVSLGYAPAPGYTRAFQRWQLERQLSSALPDVQIAFEGAQACTIAPETETLGAQAIVAAAERELRTFFGKREVTITRRGEQRDVEIPLGFEPRVLRASLADQEARGGEWSVPVQVRVDGALYQTAWVSFDVELYEALPVLVRDVRRGDVLTADSVEVRRIKRANDGKGAALAGSALLGAVAERDLPAGVAITERDVRRARLVRQGDTIQLQVRKGAITARSNAVARQDGCMGDTIRVATAGAAREVTAHIIGRDLVELELSNNATQSESAR